MRVRLFMTPWTVAHQASLPWVFSRQEHWSGLPCPPPGDLPNPGIKPRSPALQVDSLLSEPPGEPKNTGVGSSSLLQGNFPTQELNWGLLHCRQILFQLSYPAYIYTQLAIAVVIFWTFLIMLEMCPFAWLQFCAAGRKERLASRLAKSDSISFV